MDIKRILVIDDQPCNVASAHHTLKGFSYRVVDNIIEAYKILKTGEKFDVVLTDLWLPRGNFTGAMGEWHDSETDPVAAGLVFAIRAANDGMKVIICTDSDHHQDRLCSVMDLINDETYGKEKAIYFVEARSCSIIGYAYENGKITPSEDWLEKPGPRPKNWLQVMKKVHLVS